MPQLFIPVSLTAGLIPCGLLNVAVFHIYSLFHKNKEMPEIQRAVPAVLGPTNDILLSDAS